MVVVGPLIAPEFAFAAVAATVATFTQMVRARIFSAVRADVGGRFAADSAGKRETFHYFLNGLLVAGASGVLVIIPRQRCAS